MEQPISVPNKKSYAGYIIGGILLAGGIVFTFVLKGKDGFTLFQRLKNSIGEKPIPDVAIPVEAPPAGTSSWINESFPLRKGMFGGQIKNLQQALGIGADGKFGAGTESAIKAKFNTITVTKAQYDSLVNPSAVGGGSNFQRVKNILIAHGGVNQSDGITKTLQGQNAWYKFYFYTNGRMGVTLLNNNQWKMGRYSDGGSKIVMDSGKTYQSGNLTSNMLAIIKDIE